MATSAPNPVRIYVLLILLVVGIPAISIAGVMVCVDGNLFAGPPSAGVDVDESEGVQVTLIDSGDSESVYLFVDDAPVAVLPADSGSRATITNIDSGAEVTALATTDMATNEVAAHTTDSAHGDVEDAPDVTGDASSTDVDSAEVYSTRSMSHQIVQCGVGVVDSIRSLYDPILDQLNES